MEDSPGSVSQAWDTEQRGRTASIKGTIMNRNRRIWAYLLAGTLAALVFFPPALVSQEVREGEQDAGTTMKMKDSPGGQGTSMAAQPGSERRVLDYIASPFPKPPPPSTRVRVAVMDSSPKMILAGRVAVLLTRFRRRDLEASIGMKIDLVNVSSIFDKPVRKNIVTYRPGYMRAALLIAKAIPGEQSIAPLRPEIRGKDGVDIEILLGGNTR